MSPAGALIARHRKACFEFATCEPKDHDKCGKELIAAAEALEAALTSRVAGVVAPFTLSTPVDSPLHGNAGVSDRLPGSVLPASIDDSKLQSKA